MPCFYLYFKNLITDKKKFISKDLLHFIFPIVFLISKTIIDKKAFPSIPFGFIFYTIFFIYTFSYCVLSYNLLNKNVWIKKRETKVTNKQHLLMSKWTLYLFILLIINSIRLLISLFAEIYYNNFASGQSFQGIAALIWISIFFKILISPEILYGHHVFNDKINKDKIANLVLDTVWNIKSNPDLNNSQDSKLKEKVDENIIHYISEIEKISFQFESFRDPNFSLSDLATKINAPNSHIIYLFKYHSEISFSDYKKTIRIHHSIRLIELNYLKTNTLDSLAKEVGFASYNPFFTSFKNATGKSPQKYNNTLLSLKIL